MSIAEAEFPLGILLLSPPLLATSPRVCAESYSSARRRFAPASISRASASAVFREIAVALVPWLRLDISGAGGDWNDCLVEGKVVRVSSSPRAPEGVSGCRCLPRQTDGRSEQL